MADQKIPNSGKRPPEIADVPVMFSKEQVTILTGFFSSWYSDHGRPYPWREPGVRPFHVLLAEMLLRQTNADRVVPVWAMLTETFRTPGELLFADTDELRKTLAPLGFASQRTQAILDCSAELVDRFDGQVPCSTGELVTLPHIGLYSGNAISCFAFCQRLPIVDQNVLRVFSRITGADLGLDNRRSPLAWDLARMILPSRNFVAHNYGLLDFAAEICTKRHPKQLICPLSDLCASASV